MEESEMRSSIRACGSSLFIAVAAVAALAGPAAVHADSLDIFADTANSTEGLGNFSGSIDYSLDGLAGLLVIELTNISADEVGGWISGFVFNTGNVTNVSTTLVDNGGYDLIIQVNEEAGSPYGPFETGAALGGEFLGGGSPMPGIAIGDTGVFTFLIEGAGAASLSAASFLTGPNEHNFLVRFRGGEIDSDKVPAMATVIPLPAPLALGAFGLVGSLAGARRYRRRRDSN
jgi:hypothetical protein